MQSLSFTPGRAFLSSNSTTVPWTVVFEDEGVAGYFYACDRSQEKHEHSILDAMLIYNVAALAKSDAEKRAPGAAAHRVGRVVARRAAGGALSRRHGAGFVRLREAAAATAGWTFRTFAKSAGTPGARRAMPGRMQALQRFESSLYA